MSNFETNYEYHKRIARRKRDWDSNLEAFFITTAIIVIPLTVLAITLELAGGMGTVINFWANLL